MRITKNIRNGIRNLMCWLPIIWKDRQWNSYCLLILLQRKLQLMEKFLRHSAHFVGAIEVAGNIKEQLIILVRIIEDDYEVDGMEEHNKKWGRPKILFKDDRALNIVRDKVTEETKEQERTEFLAILKCADETRKADTHAFFDYMRDHFDEW